VRHERRNPLGAAHPGRLHQDLGGPHDAIHNSATASKKGATADVPNRSSQHPAATRSTRTHRQEETYFLVEFSYGRLTSFAQWRQSFIGIVYLICRHTRRVLPTLTPTVRDLPVLTLRPTCAARLQMRTRRALWPLTPVPSAVSAHARSLPF
jgi:hypothetical protein